MTVFGWVLFDESLPLLQMGDCLLIIAGGTPQNLVNHAHRILSQER